MSVEMSEGSFIPIARPALGGLEAEAAGRVIRSGWVTQGPEVAAFETEFAALMGARCACAVSNCTAALHLSLRALGVGPGAEVITVSLSFIATANSIRYCGATPVFVDVDSATLNMDPGRIEAAITDRTRAILCVHQIGMPCDISSIIEIAERRGLPVVEDAACAIGSQVRGPNGWVNIGKPHGRVACFSFHPRKVLSTGDGGMLTTSDPELDRKFRLWRQHAMSVPDTVRHTSKTVVFESYPEIGYNYRLTDIQAAVGREQIKRLPGLIEERRKLAARYTELLSSVQEVAPPIEPRWARSNWQSYHIRIVDPAVDQATVMQRMLDRNIATRRGVMCAHREIPYASSPGALSLPESEKGQDRTILLPLFHGLTASDQISVVNALKEAIEDAPCVSRQ